MIEFKTFLTEASSSSLRDPKGKLFELLVARHMHPGGYFPNMFRNNNKTPKEVHDELKEKISPDEYHKINHGAKMTSQHILKTLHTAKHPGIEKKDDSYHIGKESSVSWVSNPTDYEKLMNKHSTTDKSMKSNADIVVTHHPKGGVATHHAISLKYSSRIPTERGPGLRSLERHITPENRTPLQDISNKSNKEIHHIIGEPRRDKAKQTFKSLPKDDPLSTKIQQVSLKGITSIAKEYHAGLVKAHTNESPEQHQQRLKKVVRNLSGITHNHVHTHYRVRYNPDRDTVKMTNPVKVHKKVMEAVSKIVPTNGGTNIHFHGITHEGNQVHLGTLNVKRRDSPLSNVQGSYKLGNIYH